MAGKLHKSSAAPAPARVNACLKLAAIAAVIMLAGATGCGLERAWIYPHYALPRTIEIPPGEENIEAITLKTEVGNVDAWYFPGADASPQRPGPGMIMAHGSVELIDEQLHLIRQFQAEGICVMVPEYRGYGRSAGEPTQEAITRDFAQAYDLLASRPEVDPRRMIIHGRSLGTGIACSLATKRTPAAVVLVSPMLSLARLTRHYMIFVPDWLLNDDVITDAYNNAKVVERLDVPLFIVHGEGDWIIPITHGRKLAQLAPDATMLIYDHGHNDLPWDQPVTTTRIVAFLEHHDVMPKAHNIDGTMAAADEGKSDTFAP